MDKISTDIIIGVLIDSGMDQDEATAILKKCSAHEKERQRQMQAEEGEFKPAKLQKDGYLVLVKDKNNLLSPTASALLVQKTQCVFDINNKKVDPQLWDNSELERRIYNWMDDCLDVRPKLHQNCSFDTVLDTYPKKYAKPHGFSFIAKDTVPIIPVSEKSCMYSMFDFNELTKLPKED